MTKIFLWRAAVVYKSLWSTDRNNYMSLCICRISQYPDFTWKSKMIYEFFFRHIVTFYVCTQAFTPTANNDIASATASTVMSNQYVSIVPECQNRNESAVWLCCACICEVNWLKFEKFNHSKWWMSFSGTKQRLTFSRNYSLC